MRKQSAREIEILRLKDRVADLDAELVVVRAEAERWKAAHIDEMQKGGQRIADGLELAKAKKTLAVIDHITAGRPNDAIQEILKPMSVLFGVDVRFADDKTRVAAQRSMLESVKKAVIATVEDAKLVADEDEKAA